MNGDYSYEQPKNLKAKTPKSISILKLLFNKETSSLLIIWAMIKKVSSSNELNNRGEKIYFEMRKKWSIVVVLTMLPPEYDEIPVTFKGF